MNEDNYCFQEANIFNIYPQIDEMDIVDNVLLSFCLVLSNSIHVLQ